MNLIAGLAEIALLSAAYGSEPLNLRALDQVMKTNFEQSRVPSVAYAVVRNGKAIHVRTLGKTNLETPSSAQRESVYEIGSMTKQFTSTGILLLAQEGKLKLDDPIGKYLPNLPESWKPLTIRQCLSHTAGLKDYLATYNALSTEPVRSQQVYEKMGKMTLDFPAGSAWSYSNTGYMIATDIIELLSKEPYAKFMKSRIFDPLGMRHTSTSDPTRVIPNRARGYLPGASVTNAPVINPTLASGAGNLVSTIDDLAKWEASLQTDKLLNASMREEFFRPYELSTGKDSGYALGWFVRQDRGRPLIEHGGNTVGFSSELYRVPNENVSIIVLTNSGGIGGAQWGRQAVSALLSSYDPNRRKDADPNRDWTAHLTLTLRKWGKNKLDTTYLSSEFQKLLGTTRGLGTRLGLIQIGKIMERCVYLDGEAKGDYRSNRYRFDLPGASAIFEVQFDKAGMITSFDQLYAWRR